MTYRIVALSAGLSVPSSTRMLTDRLLEAAQAEAATHRLEVSSKVIEIRELTMGVARVMVTGMPEPHVEAALDALEAADAVIAVAPIYAGSYAGVFKSFMDLVGTERLAGTPVVVAATGGSARHSLALDYAMRPLFVTMRAHVLPTGIFAATDDFGGLAAHGDFYEGATLQSRVERAAAELVAAMRAADAPNALAPRHMWLSPHEQDVQQTVSATGNHDHTFSPSDGAVQRLGKISDEQAQKSVGIPGASSTAALLKSDGTKGRLRPDMDDFVPMTKIFGQ